MKATHIQKGNTLDYKNNGTSPINLGDVVIFGTKAAVAVDNIAVGATGSILTGEVFEVAKDTAEIGAGAKVYYDEVSDVATATVKDVEIGYAVEAAKAAAKTVKVKFLP